MARKTLLDKFPELSSAARHLLQLCAIQYEGITRKDLIQLSGSVRWKDETGKKLNSNRAQAEIKSLVDGKFLVKTGKSTQLAVNPQLADYAAQQAVRDDCFDDLASAVQNRDHAPDNRYRYGYSYGLYGRQAELRQLRDMRIAFYRGDWTEFKSLKKNQPTPLVGNGALGVLVPFDSQIFELLDPVLKEQYLIEAGEHYLRVAELSALNVDRSTQASWRARWEPRRR